MKLILNEFGKIPFLTFVFGLLLTFILLWPLLRPGYFSFHDDVQTIRLHQMDKCFKDGQIPCRWVPDLGGEYGYPLFNYYGPLPYYFGEIIYSISGSLIISTKVMFAVSFIGAYIFMYLLGTKLWGKWGGILSGVFYSYAPYHAVDFYVRGAMGEMWGLMLYPAIIWSLIRLRESTKAINILLLSLFFGMLITSHNLSTLMFLPIILGIAAYLLYTHKEADKGRFIFYGALSVILGLLIAAFYWLPMLTEKNLVHVDTTTSGYFSYTEHFKGLKKLFIDSKWGWGASVREIPGGEKDGMSFHLGWIHILGLVISLGVMFVSFKKNRRIFVLLLISNILIIFYIFLIHPRSVHFWQLLDPVMRYIQFPWRFLGPIIFILSLTVGSLATILQRRILLAILLLLVVYANYSYFRPEKFIEVNDQQILATANWDRLIKRSIFDFLPISAKAPPAELAIERFQILAGDPTVKDYQQGTNWIEFNITVKGYTIIRLSQYYFPGWKIVDNGKELNIDYDNNLGLMTIILDEGEHQIQARLYDTPVRSIGNYLTIFGLIIMVISILSFSPKFVRLSSYYYRKLSS